MLPVFFPDRNDCYTCFYNTNIYNLYQQLQALGTGADFLSVVRSMQPTAKQAEIGALASDDIAEIYLFFDFDFHDTNFQDTAKRQILNDMLAYFNDETENGKLYLHYPMVEAINFTKELPDPDFVNYKIPLADSRGFKGLCDNFTAYKGCNHLQSKHRNNAELLNYWNHLVMMHSAKASMMINPNTDTSQQFILQRQFAEMDTDGSFFVLSGFPMFLFEYFPASRFTKGI